MKQETRKWQQLSIYLSIIILNVNWLSYPIKRHRIAKWIKRTRPNNKLLIKNSLCINLEGWYGAGDRREFQKGGDMCIPVADSCWGLTENDKILLSNYPSIKNKWIFLKKNYSKTMTHQGVYMPIIYLPIWSPLYKLNYWNTD